jgi:tetratricopeptide (TPR) repeat protein
LLEPEDPPLREFYLAMIASWPPLSLPKEMLDEVREELLNWDPVQGPLVPMDLGVPIAGYVRLYLLGVVSLRLGDEDAALSYAEALERMDAPPGTGSLVTDLAYTLRALVARERGQIEEALSLIEQARYVSYYVLAAISPIYSQSASRFLRAELLAAAGRTDEAIRWYEASGSFFAFDVVNVALSHLRRAQLYEELGDRAQARRHYARFLELWRDPDPELRLMVDSARNALERLTAEAGAG